MSPSVSLDPTIARKTWRTLEPIHGLIYFAPEAGAAYEAIGLPPAMGGYFASRAAAMGPVPAEVVIATFFNFHPAFVRETIPSAWAIAAPEVVSEARLAAADQALRARLGDDVASSPAVEEAAVLARRAAESATQWPEGRPLSRVMPRGRGRRTRCSCCGTRRRCCGSSAATATSRR